MLGNMFIVIICCPVCEALNFEINHSFLIELFFLHCQSQDKNVNISRTKRAFNIKKKYSSSFLKDFHLLENVSDPRECL